MASTCLQNFSQIVFKENFQSCVKVFPDFPAPGNARIDGGGYYRTGALTNVGVGAASMVNSSTLCVIGVGQKRAASFYGGQNMAPFIPEAQGLDGQRPEA